MCKEYNGWTNYETWVVKLWMDNSISAQQHYEELARSCDLDTHSLSKALEQEHDADAPETTGVFNDLLTSALGSVNWYEIADSIVGEIEENDAYEEEQDDDDWEDD